MKMTLEGRWQRGEFGSESGRLIVRAADGTDWLRKG